MPQKIEGGYLMLQQPFIRSGAHAHTLSLDAPVNEDVLRAVNIVQSTPWRVNRFIFDLADACWTRGDRLGGLPAAEPAPLPAPFADDVWANMPRAMQVQHKVHLSAMHSANATATGAREELLRKLQIARDLVDKERWWHVWSVDFRYRMYPLSQDLNPQGDDLARALHMFADGKPIGPRGHLWIAAQLGAVFGNGVDKLDPMSRIDWVLQHEAEIVESFEEPLDGRRFWCDADAPWSFLAACQEWAMYRRHGATHISHIPIQVDGSCNGLQHLAALARDPVGAAAVNMRSNMPRQDVYTQVSDAANLTIVTDCANNEAAALAWRGKVNRATVKRAVMTTPYGVTARGMRDQFIMDGHTKAVVLDSTIVAANYLRDVVSSSIGATVASARLVMGYLQGVALAQAKMGIPLDWTLPDGARVRQAYWKRIPSYADTMWGKVLLWREDPETELATRKQELAAAPQFVHSLDALHLRRTVLAMARGGNLPSLSMVHDSYGTHACDMDLMADTLRKQFVRIYSEDLLAQFDAEQRAAHPDVKMPALPERGSYRVKEVLDAPFFFS